MQNQFQFPETVHFITALKRPAAKIVGEHQTTSEGVLVNCYSGLPVTTQKDGLTSRNRLDRRLGKTSDIRERPVSRRGEVSSLVPKHIVHPTTSYRNYKRDVPPGSPERGG